MNLFELFFHFFWHQGPTEFSRVNGMVIKILITPALATFLKIFTCFFKFMEIFNHVPSLWIIMSQLNYLKLGIGMLDSL